MQTTDTSTFKDHDKPSDIQLGVQHQTDEEKHHDPSSSNDNEKYCIYS